MSNNQKLREALLKARLFAGCSPMPFVETAMGVVDRDKLCNEIDAALAIPQEPQNNAAKMRDALKRIHTLLRAYLRHEILAESLCLNIKNEIKDALSAPARNCDVGTAEEQARRMDMYCSMHGKDESRCYRCEKCKLLREDRCDLAWAQLPYEAKEGVSDEQ